MKKCLFALLFVTSLVNAQNIELPDFVITGRQSADVQTVQKPKPELISILSKEFFTPQYSPEELPILVTSSPVSIIPDVRTSSEAFYGNLNVKVGKYSLPIGELNLYQSYENYLFGVKLWGTNTSEYITNAGYNNSGFMMTNDIYVSTRSEFLPGTKINVNASYWRDSYKLFGSLDPTHVRETNNGSAGVSFENNYSKIFNARLAASADVLSLNENNLRETNIKGIASFETKLDLFSLGGVAEYNLQQLKSDLLVSDNYSSYNAEGFIKVIPMNFLLLKGGVVYYAVDGDNLFSPFAYAEFSPERGFVISAEYKPYSEFLTNRNILSKNYYSAIGSRLNCFTKFNNNISAAIKYEFQKLFHLNATINYYNADNFVYYQDVTSKGVFDVLTISDVNAINVKVSIQVNPGIAGSFLGEVNYNSTKNSDDKFIPYQPKISASLGYLYNFDFGLGLKLVYNSCLSAYTDLANSERLEDYHDISASISFEVLKGIKITGDFQNILNKSNFAWKYYQRKPFDYLVGIDYRW